MEFKIIYGDKGRGKTTSIKKKLQNYIYIQYEDKYNKMSTEYIFKDILIKTQNKSSMDFIFKKIRDLFFQSLTNKKSMIIDNCELIETDIINELINYCTTKNIPSIYFLFDLERENLKTNNTYMNLMQICKCNEEEFEVNTDDLYAFIKENYPNLHYENYDDLIKYSYYNFNNIRLFMNINKNDKIFKIENKHYIEYLLYVARQKLNKLSKRTKEVLNISSVIGNEFSCNILEDGFKIFETNKYLKEIENMNMFIEKYIKSETEYKFLSSKIRDEIYNNIDETNKKEWIKKLINYYENEINTNICDENVLLYLLKVKELYKIFNNEMRINKINQLILFKYQKMNDIKNFVFIINEIIEYNKKNYNQWNYIFLQSIIYLKIETLIKTGYYQEAVTCIEEYINEKYIFWENKYISYFYAISLYNAGNLDLSYTITKQLVDDIKETSGNGDTEQPLYALVYSLYSSILDHLEIDNTSELYKKYYRLAINNAKKLSDKNIYYSIIKKIKFTNSYQDKIDKLKECIEFYEKENNSIELGEVYLNIGTEILFNECSSSNSKYYLEKSYKIYEVFCNEKTSYAANNLAIYYILEENKIEKALQTLKRVCYHNLTDFTNITLYLNICMCYILLNKHNSVEFQEAYKKFQCFFNNIMKRENRSQYEVKYFELLNAILLEKQCKTNELIKKCNDMLCSIDYDKTNFFYPVINDIINRNSKNIAVSYKKNIAFYKKINEKKIFLAEFRFWS